MTETQASPIQIVEAFLGEWSGGIDALRRSFADYLAEDVNYANVGLTHTYSQADAIAIIDGFMPGIDSIRIDMLAIAGHGDKVLTERIDHICDANGTVMASIALMGIFEVRDGRITSWRDYFDTVPFAGGA